MTSSYTEEKLNILLVLLEKAEQILSIINLSDNVVKKYNQLKDLTFEKLNLPFKPLVKRGSEAYKENNKTSSAPNDNLCNTLYDILHVYRAYNAKKNLVIEFLLDLIEKFKFEGSAYVRQIINDRDNILQIALDKLHNDVNINYSKNIEDFEFDMKMEEIKIKDFLGNSEICFKKLMNSLKSNSSSFSSSPYTKNVINSEDIIKDYERKIEEINRMHERDIQEYKDRFSELRMKYKPDIESDFNRLKNDFEEMQFIVDKVNELVTPVFDKYYQKNASWYENERIDFKYPELDKINFMTCLVNKFFVDNKYLIDLVTNLQKEKNTFLDERNLPYVANAIQNNELLSEIHEQSKQMQNQSENFHRNFEQLIDYINKNFENV